MEVYCEHDPSAEVCIALCYPGLPRAEKKVKLENLVSGKQVFHCLTIRKEPRDAISKEKGRSSAENELRLKFYRRIEMI